MADLEKVKKGLECCARCTNDEPFAGCDECPYDEISISVQECRAVLCVEALEVIENAEIQYYPAGT